MNKGVITFHKIISAPHSFPQQYTRYPEGKTGKRIKEDVITFKYIEEKT